MTRAERAAKNEAVFREVNEKIEGVALSQPGDSERLAVLCECSQPTCVATVDITVDEYEATRADGTHFVLIAGHEDLGIERVVERTDRFLVVQKTNAGADVARGLDPRS